LRPLGHWVILLSDVTQLVVLNQLRTRMIRMASHDLKNPLGTAVGYAELIRLQAKNNPLPGKAEQYLGYISGALTSMNQIISDILDLEQLRSGSAKYE